MERTKEQFIKELKQTAQDNVWKNELVIKYRQANPSGDEKKDATDISATEEIIKKDLAYIAFLNENSN